MEIQLKLNGRPVRDSIDADTLLIDFVRAHGCASVKRGCETSNCGLCTVLLDGKPVLSCSVLAARADGHEVQTLEGLLKACPNHTGDWYFSCDSPTPGGAKQVNQAFIDYIEELYQF